MTNEEFYEAALKTENLDFDGISERMDYYAHEYASNITEAIDIGEELDKLKKQIFYGKDMGLYVCPSESAPIYEASDDILRLEHAVLGIATEAVELLQAIYEHKFNNKPLDWTNIGEECGDLNWYEAVMNDLLEKHTEGGIDHWNERVIEKLRKRHGDKFNDKKVMDRDLEAEREILES